MFFRWVALRRTLMRLLMCLNLLLLLRVFLLELLRLLSVALLHLLLLRLVGILLGHLLMFSLLLLLHLLMFLVLFGGQLVLLLLILLVRSCISRAVRRVLVRLNFSRVIVVGTSFRWRNAPDLYNALRLPGLVPRCRGSLPALRLPRLEVCHDWHWRAVRGWNAPVECARFVTQRVQHDAPVHSFLLLSTAAH
jgi:hypothetical protein